MLSTQIKAFTDAAADAVARAIAGVQREAERAEQLRQAEYRAFFAEQRETVSGLIRKVEERLAEVKDGKDGERGEKGETGQPGKDGEQGPAGRDGANGVDGRDGIDGKDGADADMHALEKRIDDLVAAIPVPENGKDGRDGIDGKDADMEALQKRVEEMVAEFPVPQDGKDGEPGKDAYPGEVKGLFDLSATYRARDIVKLNGSSWIAKVDDPGDIPGEGWMQLASTGKRGERGERGPDGRVGKDGKDGSTPVELKFDAEKMMFVMALDDGSVLEADFYPVAKAIRGE